MFMIHTLLSLLDSRAISSPILKAITLSKTPNRDRVLGKWAHAMRPYGIFYGCCWI